MCFISIQMTMKMDGFHQVIAVERFVLVRGWTSYPQDSKHTHDQAEHFLRFLDKYVSHAVGNHYFL
jgi:hypothetical protein